jgi:hypothetical protein
MGPGAAPHARATGANAANAKTAAKIVRLGLLAVRIIEVPSEERLTRTPELRHSRHA